MFIVDHAGSVHLDELLHLVPHPRLVLMKEPVDVDHRRYCILNAEIPHEAETTFLPQFLQLEKLGELEDFHCVLVEVGGDGATVQVPQEDLHGQGARVVDDEPAFLGFLHVVGKCPRKDFRSSSKDGSVARKLPILANQGEVGVEATGKDAPDVINELSPRGSHMLLRRCLDADFDPGLQSDVSAGVEVLLKEGFLLVVFYHRTVPEDQPTTERYLAQRLPLLRISGCYLLKNPLFEKISVSGCFSSSL